MLPENICFWTAQPDEIWSCVKHCVTNRKEVPFCGYWIRRRLPWVRTLRKYIEQPLIDKSAIEKRLDAVDELVKNAISREEIREYLSPVYDLERLVCRITYESANPRDLIAFQSSLAMLPHIKYILNDMQTPLLKELNEELDTLGDLCKAGQ